MGQEMDHPHATAQVIGHGRDELSPRHILDSDIVVRIRVSLAQIFTQEFDCPVSCGVGNGKIVTPYKRFYGMTKSVHSRTSHHMGRLESHESGFLNRRGRPDAGCDDNEAVSPFHVIHDCVVGAFRPGSRGGVDRHLRKW